MKRYLYSRVKKEKIQKNKKPVIHHQVDQQMHCGSFRRRKEKVAQKITEEIVVENFPNLMKDLP